MAKFGKENFDEGNKWRVRCKEFLEYAPSGYIVKVVNPNDYFGFHEEQRSYETQREIMEFDLNKVRHSDFLICNFNDMWSLGTMSELAIAYEHRIPVIGLNETGQELHPWQIEFCTRIFTDIDKMLEYVKDFYLT